jgi:hypothetical protein
MIRAVCETQQAWHHKMPVKLKWLHRPADFAKSVLLESANQGTEILGARVLSSVDFGSVNFGSVVSAQ